jgi:hypothetical protein
MAVIGGAIWAASQTRGGDFSGVLGSLGIIAGIVLVVYACLVARELLLDTLAQLWSIGLRIGRRGKPADSSPTPSAPIVPSNRSPLSCPRCGARIPMGYTECDVCLQLGIPPAPKAEVWIRPVDAGDAYYAAASGAWINRGKDRDPEKEIAHLRAQTALILMVGVSFAGLMGGILLGSGTYDWGLLMLAGFTLMAGDFVRRLWIAVLPPGAVLTAATAIRLLADLHLAPLGLVAAAVVSSALVIQAFAPLRLLKRKREEAQDRLAA